MKKAVIFFTFSFVAFGAICWIFWEQELKYSLPTPKPTSFLDVPLGTIVDIDLPGIQNDKASVLHFFSPDCPCSRFNMQNFRSTARKYGETVNFVVVLQTDDEDEVRKFNDTYGLGLPVVIDKDGKISDACGIYSTPQAVILAKDRVMYFKGNYNKSRYCTRKETSYAEIALDSLIKGQPLPLFLRNEMTVPYGCTLPSDETDLALSIF
jgi:hypothetical protein